MRPLCRFSPLCLRYRDRDRFFCALCVSDIPDVIPLIGCDMNIECASGWSRAVVEIWGDKAKLRKAEGCMRLRLVEKVPLFFQSGKTHDTRMFEARCEA